MARRWVLLAAERGSSTASGGTVMVPRCCPRHSALPSLCHAPLMRQSKAWGRATTPCPCCLHLCLCLWLHDAALPKGGLAGRRSPPSLDVSSCRTSLSSLCVVMKSYVARPCPCCSRWGSESWGVTEVVLHEIRGRISWGREALFGERAAHREASESVIGGSTMGGSCARAMVWHPGGVVVSIRPEGGAQATAWMAPTHGGKVEGANSWFTSGCGRSSPSTLGVRPRVSTEARGG